MEDPEKKRLRQLAETAGSLAPSRIGAWTTPGVVHGDPWSKLPWVARIAFILIGLACLTGIGLLIAIAAHSGDTALAAGIAVFLVVIITAFAVGRLRGRS